MRPMPVRRLLIMMPLWASLAPIPALAAEYAPPAAGLEIRYSTHGAPLGSERIVAIEGDSVIVDRKDGEDSQTDRLILWRGLLLLEASFRSEQDFGVERFDPSPETPLSALAALWPPRPGDSVSIRMTHLIGSGDSDADARSNLNKAGTKTVVLTVEAIEPVMVPAGRFDAVRIRRETVDAPDGDEPETLTETLWFVPSLGYYAKVVSVLGDDDPEEVVAEEIRHP